MSVNHKKKLCIFMFLSAILLDFMVAAILLKDQKADDLYYRCQHEYYHHGLKPNIDNVDTWFNNSYRITTNSLGLKGMPAEMVLNKANKKRVVFIGDSFTEGIGVTYNETFIGLLSQDYPDIDFLNAGVASYSPKLYNLKIRHLWEQQNIRFDELVIMIDMSDIQDEVIYSGFKPRITSKHTESFFRTTYIFLVNHSIIWNRIFRQVEKYKLKKGEIGIASSLFGYNHPNEFWGLRDKWTSDSTAWELWGKKGAELAKVNMQKLIDFCNENNVKATIIIYPWIEQINKNEINCLQVETWKKFSNKNNITFIDLFPFFLSQETDSFINTNYIKGDVHWNTYGHRKVKEAIEHQLFSVKQ